MILYGLEESAIIPDKRLRSKPKFMPFIRPNQRTDGKKRTTSYTPYSAAMKNYVQKSGSYAQKSRCSGSFKEQSGSSKGYSVLFKGRTFSSGKKIFFNRNQNFQSDSDTESDSDSSSTTSSLAQDGGMTASRSLKPQQTGPKTNVFSSAGRNVIRKSPRIVLRSSSSTSGKSEKYLSDSDEDSSEDDAEDNPTEDNPTVVKSPTVQLPRINIRRLSDSVVKSLSSPKKDKQHEMPEVNGSMDSSSKNPESMESASSSQSPQNDMSQIRITDVKSLTDQEEQLFGHKEMETDDKILNMNEGQGNSEKRSDEAETGNVRKSASELNSTTASKKVAVLEEEEVLPLPDIEVDEREVDGMENSQKEAGMNKSSGAVEPSRNEGNSSQESTSFVQWKKAESGSRSARQTGGKGARGPEKGQSPDSTNVQNVMYNDADTAAGSTQSDKPTGSTSSSSKTTNSEETLRLLINQLTSLTSDSLDCKIIFSNSNQVLTIGEGRKGSVRERSMDIKPNVDQINLRENPQLPDSNNGTSRVSSKQGNFSGTGNPRCDGGVRGESSTVPNVQVKEEREWAGLGKQTEADAIIIIDSDDE